MVAALCNAPSSCESWEGSTSLQGHTWPGLASLPSIHPSFIPVHYTVLSAETCTLTFEVLDLWEPYRTVPMADMTRKSRPTNGLFGCNNL